MCNVENTRFPLDRHVLGSLGGDLIPDFSQNQRIRVLSHGRRQYILESFVGILAVMIQLDVSAVIELDLARVRNLDHALIAR